MSVRLHHGGDHRHPTALVLVCLEESLLVQENTYFHHDRKHSSMAGMILVEQVAVMSHNLALACFCQGQTAADKQQELRILALRICAGTRMQCSCKINNDCYIRIDCRTCQSCCGLCSILWWAFWRIWQCTNAPNTFTKSCVRFVPWHSACSSHVTIGTPRRLEVCVCFPAGELFLIFARDPEEI